MQKGKFLVEVELDNGVWKCECEGFAYKNAPRFHVDITPPISYTAKSIFSSKTTDFIYDGIMLEFNFELWPWLMQGDDYEEELQDELSAYLMRQIMWDETIEEA